MEMKNKVCNRKTKKIVQKKIENYRNKNNNDGSIAYICF